MSLQRVLLPFPLHVFVVTDASGANKKSDHAVEGISLLVSEDRLKELHPDAWDYLPESASQYLGGKCHLMLASSTKSKRISHSTSHAETLAGARGLPMAQLLAIRYCEHEIVAQKQSKVTPLQEIPPPLGARSKKNKKKHNSVGGTDV